MCESKTQASKTRLFSISYRNSETFNYGFEKSFEKKYFFLLYSTALGNLFTIEAVSKCFPLTAGFKIKSKIPDFERGKAIPPMAGLATGIH